MDYPKQFIYTNKIFLMKGFVVITLQNLNINNNIKKIEKIKEIITYHAIPLNMEMTRETNYHT